MREFKKMYTLEQRLSESERIRINYPDKIPVIVEKNKNSEIMDIDKRKYLVPSELTLGQFIYVIRKRIKIAPEEAIFLFINDALPPSSSLMSQVYKENKDQDGFLYTVYSGESTFG